MIPYPATRHDPIVDTLHGRTVADPYRWLEDERNPDVQQWMEAQDALARAALHALPGREALMARLRTLLYFDALSAPVHRGGRYFYTRKHADREKTVVYWREGEEGVEQVLFDPNRWSTDGTSGLGGWWPSDDGRYIAYAIKEHNSDETTTRIRDVGADSDLPEVIAGTKYSGASWAPGAAGFYYTQVPPVGGAVTVSERPGFAEVKFHRLGTEAAADVVVHGATGDPRTFIAGVVSRDGRWLRVEIQHGWTSTEIFVRDAGQPAAPWQTLVSGVDATFDVHVWKDRFYVLTNDGAPRYRVFRVDPGALARESWVEIVPESDATIESMTIAGEHLALHYLHHAATEIELRTLDGAFVRRVDLPPLGTSGGLIGNPDEDTAYFSYTSFTEPQIIYRTSITTGAVREWTRITLPIDTSALRTEQVHYRSKDGTRVSMFVLYKAGTRKDGTNPAILYGYGGFNVNLTPAFGASRAMWLEAGGVYAIPNLRGGGEYGEQWHRDGMLLRKQNVFDDFMAAADCLVAEGWTSPQRLAVSGGSNGGLLVGAVITQRPDLCRAVVCSVPLLDMVRYHLSGSGRTWVLEYGSAEDPAQFAAICAYAVPGRGRRRAPRLPGRALRVGRPRRPCRSAARAQDDRGAPGEPARGAADPPAHRAQRRPWRRRHGAPDR
ncbi:MAG TPA: prolyl oligopeptidase family serine peptidase [Vicinamibacterales bacterium]|nr:prolyl oligopeptidase family serine peptidase [Vicinamibacterales bacterium]